MKLNWEQISETVTTQLTAFGLKVAGAIAVWIVGRYLIGLAVRLVSAALSGSRSTRPSCATSATSSPSR